MTILATITKPVYETCLTSLQALCAMNHTRNQIDAQKERMFLQQNFMFLQIFVHGLNVAFGRNL